MAIHVLGVSGSPREVGATTRLVRAALLGAEAVPDVTTEFVALAGREIHGCTGCGQCAKLGRCVIDDDMQPLYERLVALDSSNADLYNNLGLTLRAQGTRNANGRVTIVAYTPGEEDFTDLNGNSRWDAGETFTDLGQAFRDDNANNTYDPGEFFVPRTGASTCAGGLLGRPNTCDGTWGEADLRAQTVVVFSTTFANFGTRTGSAAQGACARRRSRMAFASCALTNSRCTSSAR